MSIVTKPSFTKYIETYHDWYCIDSTNKRLLQVLSLYCKGRSEFESIDDKEYKMTDQQGLYLEKGIMLIGNVGTGKTEMLRMMGSYLKFLGVTGTQFRIESVPDIADRFSIKGREVFDVIRKGNWMFDELCFLNEKTGRPDREIAINFGDKILIGEKLIYDRYAEFKENGWRSHFTTNASLQQIKDIYGNRVYSRLMEMCNVFVYSGKDRRFNRRPHTIRNLTQQNIKEVPVIKPAEQAEEIISSANSKESLQISYSSFIAKGQYLFIHPTEYDMLIGYGCELEPLTEYMIELRAESPKADDDILEGYAKRKAVAAYYSKVNSMGKNFLDFPK